MGLLLSAFVAALFSALTIAVFNPSPPVGMAIFVVALLVFGVTLGRLLRWEDV